MKARWFPAPLVSASIWLVASGWIVWAIATEGSPDNWKLVLVGCAVVALGEVLEVDIRGGRSTPVSGAVIFALFIVSEPRELVIAIVPAFLIGMAFRSRGVAAGARFRSTSRRLGAVLFARAVYLSAAGPLTELVPGVDEMLIKTMVMVAAALVELFIDTGASAIFISNAQHIPFGQLWLGQIRNRVALHGALVSIAALMALAYEKLGWSTFVLFLMPLLAARYAFKRYATIHSLYVQTVRALSKVPEFAGYAPQGHSIAVAELATSLGRDLGLGDNEVQDLEFAALLHDVGRLSLADPGAPSKAMDQRRVAESSAELIMKTSYLSRVGKIVKDSELCGTGSGPVLLESRILKVANDYVERISDAGGADSNAALQRMVTKPKSYDPEVVESLQRLLKRQGDLIAV